jgi:hypothetical protein
VQGVRVRRAEGGQPREAMLAKLGVFAKSSSNLTKQAVYNPAWTPEEHAIPCQ